MGQGKRRKSTPKLLPIAHMQHAVHVVMSRDTAGAHKRLKFSFTLRVLLPAVPPSQPSPPVRHREAVSRSLPDSQLPLHLHYLLWLGIVQAHTAHTEHSLARWVNGRISTYVHRYNT